MIPRVDKAADLEAALKMTQGMIVVKVTAKWCVPCKIVAPIVEQIASEYPSVCFLEIDRDCDEFSLMTFEKMGVPCFHFFINGFRFFTVLGAKPDTLRHVINAFKDNRTVPNAEHIAQVKKSAPTEMPKVIARALGYNFNKYPFVTSTVLMVFFLAFYLIGWGLVRLISMNE